MADAEAIFKALAALSGGGSEFFSTLQEGRAKEEERKRLERQMQLQEEQAKRAQAEFDARQEDRQLQKRGQATDILSTSLERLGTRVTPGGEATRVEAQGPKGVASEAIALPVEERTGEVTQRSLAGTENLIDIVAANTGLQPDQVRQLFPGASVLADAAAEGRRRDILEQSGVEHGFLDFDDPDFESDLTSFLETDRELDLEGKRLGQARDRASIAASNASTKRDLLAYEQALKAQDPKEIQKAAAEMDREIALEMEDIIRSEEIDFSALSPEEKAQVGKRAAAQVAQRLQEAGEDGAALEARRRGILVARKARRIGQSSEESGGGGNVITDILNAGPKIEHPANRLPGTSGAFPVGGNTLFPRAPRR